MNTGRLSIFIYNPTFIDWKPILNKKIFETMKPKLNGIKTWNFCLKIVRRSFQLFSQNDSKFLLWCFKKVRCKCRYLGGKISDLMSATCFKYAIKIWCKFSKTTNHPCYIRDLLVFVTSYSILMPKKIGFSNERAWWNLKVKKIKKAISLKSNTQH